MATQGKAHGLGREKRGISPSFSTLNNIAQRKRIPPPSAISSPSPSPSAQKLVSTPSEKRLPNYLKPTRTSALDPSINGRKQPSNATTQKPTLSRIRSFDKPPSSPSRLLKPNTSINRTFSDRTIRSSSTVPKAASSLTKSHHERSLKAHQDTKKTPSFFDIKKKDKKKNISFTVATSMIAPVPEYKQEDQESSVTDVEEEMINVESNNELSADIPKREEDTDRLKDELEKNRYEDLKSCTTSIVSEDEYETLDVHMEEDVDEEIVDETRGNHGTDDDRNKGERNESHPEPEEGFAGIPGTENGEKEVEERETEKSGENDQRKKEEVDGSGSQIEAKPENIEEVVSGSAEVTKEKGKNGKKEAQVSNDLIEETARKLLEKRKNKVKALVGAFEAVMSL
ncbi:hypothetical protein U1Q18_041908 [Sarracenia purpurea var. burkii]